MLIDMPASDRQKTVERSYGSLLSGLKSEGYVLQSESVNGSLEEAGPPRKSFPGRVSVLYMYGHRQSADQWSTGVREVLRDGPEWLVVTDYGDPDRRSAIFRYLPGKKI